MHTLATSELSSVIGLSSCYWGLCSKWGAMMPLSISQILLHCPPWCYYQEIVGGAQRCSEEILVLLSRIWWDWHVSCLPSSTAFFGSLCRQHTSFRCTKWTMLFDYRSKTHQSHQGALAKDESCPPAQSNSLHQPTPRQAPCNVN